MKRWLLLPVLLLQLAYAQTDSAIIRSIYNEILLRGQCYSTLDYLSNHIGGRLSGSVQAAKAVNYTFEKLKSYGFDTVYLQEVMVPHWERGAKEEAFIVNGKERIQVSVCALGNSVATPQEGIEAEVIEMHSFKELEEFVGKLPDKATALKGKIVFFNRPMDPLSIHTGSAYGGAVDQRGRGAIEAAKYGAIGVVVRSVTLACDDFPHTGAMQYADTITKIPACAISTIAAEKLSKMLKENAGKKLKFFFRQHCKKLPDEKSYNVVAQINGALYPNEILLVGGHLDAWDNGKGAHDDGAGVVQSMEALRVFKALGIRPARTLRCVLFMNEENGLKGALKYAELAKQNNEKHIAAIETDGGGFTPRGFGIDANEKLLEVFEKWIPLLNHYGIHEMRKGGGGADISPLKNQGAILIGYMCDSQRYFDYHHTANDTFDKVNKRELELGAGAIAALLWLISEKGIAY
jgi:hypothetical protein